MRTLFTFIALAAILSVTNVTTGRAQSVGFNPLSPPPATGGVPSFGVGGDKGPQPVQISVSYQFFMTGAINELDQQTQLADAGRRQVYRMLAQECQVLLETVASTCAMERANVNTQITKQRPNNDGVRVTGSATYRIDLTPTKKTATSQVDKK